MSNLFNILDEIVSVENKLNNKINIVSGATPSAVSQLENDAGYINAVECNEIIDNYSNETYIELSSAINIDNRISGAADSPISGGVPGYSVKYLPARTLENQEVGMTIFVGKKTGVFYLEDGDIQASIATLSGTQMLTQRGKVALGKDENDKPMLLLPDEKNIKTAYYSYDGKTWNKCQLPSECYSFTYSCTYNEKSKLWICGDFRQIRGQGPGPDCLFYISTNGRTFELTPDYYSPTSSYSRILCSAIPYKTGFILPSSAEKKLIYVDNFIKENDIWKFDVQLLTNTNILDMYSTEPDSIYIRSAAIGNEIALFADQGELIIGCYNFITKKWYTTKIIEPERPGVSGIGIKHITYANGWFYIATYQGIYKTTDGHQIINITTNVPLPTNPDDDNEGAVYGIDVYEDQILIGTIIGGTIKANPQIISKQIYTLKDISFAYLYTEKVDKEEGKGLISTSLINKIQNLSSVSQLINDVPYLDAKISGEFELSANLNADVDNHLGINTTTGNDNYFLNQKGQWKELSGGGGGGVTYSFNYPLSSDPNNSVSFISSFLDEKLLSDIEYQYLQEMLSAIII